MKIKNTPEEKARFFALYYGQKGIVYRQGFVNRDNIEIKHIDEFDKLELTPLSKISEADAIEVAKIVCARHNRHYKENEISYEIKPGRGNLDVIVCVKNAPRYIVQITSDGIAFVEHEMGGASRVHHYAPGQYQATHFLRSRGYYVGDGTEIEYGWVKLI